ncbi:MAG: MBL fold metallo-hydrolase [Phycisphaerae bacterium]|nr:MBL fold metallo-hydrolase [Phycisphaerae bacterium]
MTILTDPVFSERIGMSLGPWTFGLRRHAPSPVLELPPIDLILISHSHFDHLDRPTLRRLVDRHTRVITAANTRRLIPSGFGEVIELAWDRAANINGLRIAAMKPKHWGARTAWDRHRGYNSYVIEGPRAQVLFAGDTAYTDAFKGVRSDLAIFGIGAYDPWIANHANPEQVWDMFQQMPGEFLLPIHHSTFEMSDEPAHEPMDRLVKAAGSDAARIVGRAMASQWKMEP